MFMYMRRGGGVTRRLTLLGGLLRGSARHCKLKVGEVYNDKWELVSE